MISPLIELDDAALAEAKKALREWLGRTDMDYAAAVCVSAYLIELAKRNRSNGGSSDD